MIRNVIQESSGYIHISIETHCMIKSQKERKKTVWKVLRKASRKLRIKVESAWKTTLAGCLLAYYTRKSHARISSIDNPSCYALCHHVWKSTKMSHLNFSARLFVDFFSNTWLTRPHRANFATSRTFLRKCFWVAVHRKSVDAGRSCVVVDF